MWLKAPSWIIRPDPTLAESPRVPGGVSPTTVWKHEWRCVRKGGLSCRARTLFSTIVHSTSSSWITTSFFRILTAYSSSVAFISTSMTYGDAATGPNIQKEHFSCPLPHLMPDGSPCQSCLFPAQPGRRNRRVWPGPWCWRAWGWTVHLSRTSSSYLGPAWLSAREEMLKTETLRLTHTRDK